MAAVKLTSRQLGLLRRCLGPGGVAHASRVLSPALLQQSRMGSGGPAPWNYLWKPGPYPKTEEEMCAAAKKYGMIREDYRPYPDNGMGMGDYPDLGRSSGAKRPRMMWYDDEDLKRNFGDPTGWDFYHTKEVGWDSEAYKNRHTPESTFCVTMAIFAGIAFFWYLTGVNNLGDNCREISLPVAEAQNPWRSINAGKKFYTFEKPE